MDNDKHVDLVAQNGVIYQWNSDGWKFSVTGDSETNIGVDCPSCHIIAADMDFDGYNDFLVQRPATESSAAHDVVECFLFNREVYQRTKQRRYNSIGIVANLTSNQQFSIFDHNSDMLIDLIGIDLNGELAVWNNLGMQADPITGIPRLEFKKTTFSTFSQRSIITPFVPIFADIDGDCNADVVLLTCNDKRSGTTPMATCQKPVIEFYINYQGHYQYMSAKDILAPRGIGRLSVGDMNRDGNMDLIFPVCYPHPTCEERNDVQVLYNEQIPMCTTIWFSGSNCRKQSDLCTQEKFTFGVRIDTIPLGYDRYLVSDDNLPPTLRISDWNMDGFPDLALAVKYRSKPGISKVEILNNVQCNEHLCGAQNGEPWTSQNRTFQKQTEGMEDVDELNNVRAAFFMDLDESGSLDLFVLSSSLDGSQNKSMVTGFFNNFHPDAFFFKTMGLNGVTTSGGFGAIVPGFTFKFDIPINDVTGGKLPRVGSQFTSSSYMSLQPPYSFFGLGRENGYIENFFMGAPVTDSSGTKYVKHEPGIIPNSQLICIPKPLERPSQWELQLFVSPTSHSIWVVLGVLITLILFGIPIVVCWIAERRKDHKTRQRSQAMRTFL